jgi:hypothetical protein
MKGKEVDYSNHGWIETTLEPEHIVFLWQRIEEKKESLKENLAGNISGSYSIEDTENYFFNEVLSQHVDAYTQIYGGHPIRDYAYGDFKLQLGKFWVNYQNKHEFNPYHHHGGVYSFVAWMKIPTDWREQNQLPFLEGVKEEDKKASIFEFEYHDILGNIRNYGYRLDPTFEGKLLFFPSALRHCVYPFYNSDEQRISVSGNLIYNQC